MLKFILSLIIFCLMSFSSSAYLGPGIGTGAIVATLGIIIAIFATLFGLIWFPIKKLLKKRKEKKDQQENKVD